jgi:hypothetical protein
MFGLVSDKAAKAGMTSTDYLGSIVEPVTGGRTSRVSELTFAEANEVIKILGGDPFRAYGNSKRNENYKKQQAGIKTVETELHVTAIREAAALRNMGEEGLTSLAARMHLPWPPHTTEQGNKIFEAIKAMNKRDNVVAFPVRTESDSDRVPAAHQEPSFRRVA